MRRKGKPTVLELGSYSSGTMRPEDLIPAFLDAARELHLARADRHTIRAIDARSARSEYFDTEDPDQDLSELFDLLDRYTPDYCYFGAHPGDGADYGVWVVEEILQDARQGSYDGNVYRLAAGTDRSSVPTEYSHVLEVNDHGNCTLWRRSGRSWRECWAIV